MAEDACESYATQLLVKNKWVFKIGCNGVYWAHIVACRYSQVTCVDFSEKYSPVVNEITFQILLLMMIHFGYLAKIVNVEIAFLYGDIEEEIYMECPKGMKNVVKDDCVISNKCF